MATMNQAADCDRINFKYVMEQYQIYKCNINIGTFNWLIEECQRNLDKDQEMVLRLNAELQRVERSAKMVSLKRRLAYAEKKEMRRKSFLRYYSSELEETKRVLRKMEEKIVEDVEEGKKEWRAGDESEGDEGERAGEESEGDEGERAGEESEGDQGERAGEESEGDEGERAGEESEGDQGERAGEESEEDEGERAGEETEGDQDEGNVGCFDGLKRMFRSCWCWRKRANRARRR